MFILIYIALAVVVVLLIIVALQPGDFRIERSATITAPPQRVFEQVNDFHKWTGWSPWEKMDPALNRTYTGSPAGAGAVYAWAGNKQVGEGRMTITDSRPYELIRIKLEFLKPFQATNTAEFTFKPEDNATRVIWSMTGTRNFMFKLCGLFMSMEKMVGPQFEQGLASMKSVSETA